MEAEHKITKERVNPLSEKEKEIKEITENPIISPSTVDDLTEYIQGQSLSELMSRFGVADEDESIRNEDFNPLVVDSKTAQKHKHSASRSSAFKNELVLDDEEMLKNTFGEAQSEYDNDAVAFEDIKIEAFEELGESKNISFKQGFNTHTRVIFVDDGVNDGIRRNTDLDVTDVFEKNQ